MLGARFAIAASWVCRIFQFPSWFVCQHSNLVHRVRCQRLPEGLSIAVEFRHKAWFDETHRSAVFERRHGFAHVVADEPQSFSRSIPALWELAASAAVVRLHPRNAETPDAKGLPSAAERFTGRYSEDELTAWLPVFGAWLRSLNAFMCLFNDHYGDDVQQHATRLRDLLGV